MPHTTLFISDLHLCGERPAITGLFLEFMRTPARGADALYILGDLFEYWIGDEAVEEPEQRPIVEGLRALTGSGTPVFVLHGNRDFLMGAGFEAATGVRLLADPTRIDLYGTPVLVMHGDALCTDDAEYMAFRRIVRNADWQRRILALPVPERHLLFRRYREMSMVATTRKRPEIMDVAPAAVESAMRTHGVHRLIHGHTHRPGEHRFRLDGAPARRLVLGDWYEQGSVLRAHPDGWRLGTMPLPAERQHRVRR